MEKYEANSHKAREEKKKLKKVVSGPVITKKKSGFSGLADTFITEDVENVKQYIIMDVIIPTVKDTVLEMIRMFFYGGTGKSSSSYRKNRPSYRDYYDNDSGRKTRQANYRRDGGLNYEDIIFKTRMEASEVLDILNDTIDQYEIVTVSDLHDLAGIIGPHTGNRYGWSNLNSAKIIRVRDGYLLELPKPLPIDSIN